MASELLLPTRRLRWLVEAGGLAPMISLGVQRNDDIEIR